MSAYSELDFFVKLVKHGSLASLARDSGITPSAVSARLANIEKRLGVRLLNRTTRRLSTTHESELYLAEGSRLLIELCGTKCGFSLSGASEFIASQSDGEALPMLQSAISII